MEGLEKMRSRQAKGLTANYDGFAYSSCVSICMEPDSSWHYRHYFNFILCNQRGELVRFHDDYQPLNM